MWLRTMVQHKRDASSCAGQALDQPWLDARKNAEQEQPNTHDQSPEIARTPDLLCKHHEGKDNHPPHIHESDGRECQHAATACSYAIQTMARARSHILVRIRCGSE